MDSIYGLYNNNASSKINLKEYFDTYSNLLPYTQPGLSVFDVMGVDLENDEKRLLSEYCSVDRLTVNGELPKFKYDKIVKHRAFLKQEDIPSTVKLETVEEQKKREDSTHIARVLKYQGEKFINYEKVKNAVHTLTPGKDIIVYIRVYEPFVSSKNTMIFQRKDTRVSLRSVVAILGFQTLADLRDVILCSSDLCMSVESSDTPNVRKTEMTKDIYKSGFFFVEDTFYNDFRDSQNIDTSKVIIDWAKSHELGPFETGSMENARIDSLHTRFGYPWVYQHQGSCEHLIMFSDARLVTYNDELAVSAYPKIDRIKPQTSKYCMICRLFHVSWIVTDSDRVPHDPCYFCDICFRSYNYIDGKKIGNFKAYPFPYHSELVKQAEDYAKGS